MKNFKTVTLVLLFSCKYVFSLTGICPKLFEMPPGVREKILADSEAFTAIAISQANFLSSTCVPTPVDPNTLAACTSTFTAYTETVTKLSYPCTLDVTVNPEYLALPFTPCKYTAAGIFYFPYCSFNE